MRLVFPTAMALIAMAVIAVSNAAAPPASLRLAYVSGNAGEIDPCG